MLRPTPEFQLSRGNDHMFEELDSSPSTVAFMDTLRRKANGAWTGVQVYRSGVSGGKDQVTFELELASAAPSAINSAFDRFRELFPLGGEAGFPDGDWFYIQFIHGEKILDGVLSWELINDTWYGQHNEIPYSLERKVRSLFDEFISPQSHVVRLSLASGYFLVECELKGTVRFDDETESKVKTHLCGLFREFKWPDASYLNRSKVNDWLVYIFDESGPIRSFGSD